MIPSTQRFSSRVDYYVRSRPRYPAALLRFFQSELSLSPLHVVADIGSGTGFLSELFVRNGNPTLAIEPNEPMRSAGEAYLKEWPNFQSINGTAEATTLAGASVDIITAGQAFHWFDVPRCRQEFQRILKPGGIVALLWNERIPGGSPFMIDYEKLIETYHRQDLPDDDGMNEIARFFGALGFKIAKFANPQVLDQSGLIDRIVSSSYMPLPTDRQYQAMVEDAKTLFKLHQQNQTISILHETQVFYGLLGP